MSLNQSLSFSFSFLVLLVPGIILLGIIAGFYPALYLSSLREVTILKKDSGSRFKGKSLRYFLVVFQFVVSMTLIAVTFLIIQQVTFLKKKDTGIREGISSICKIAASVDA